MSKSGSVAPKERVNIVYKPATGDVQEDVELPLKLMVLGDFTGREDTRTVEDRPPISIDKDNFNDVMKGQGLGVTLAVPNKLSGEEDPDNQLAVELKFQSMRDFEPDSIVQQVPELAKLIELREALKALKGPLSNVPDFRKKVQELVGDAAAREAVLKELGLDNVSEDKE